jgi:hypothetical protein
MDIVEASLSLKISHSTLAVDYLETRIAMDYLQYLNQKLSFPRKQIPNVWKLEPELPTELMICSISVSNVFQQQTWNHLNQPQFDIAAAVTKSNQILEAACI